MAHLSSETLHATSIAIGDRAVIIVGPSGSGKSDLALRLIDRGATLISDDQTLVRLVNGEILATSFGTIKGKMEVRGIGIIECSSVADIPVALIVDLRSTPERYPLESNDRFLLGQSMPVLALSTHENSAPIKVEIALKQIAK
jgi:serine kinase of HPr protein (carbohydrate metabolism regulator)